MAQGDLGRSMIYNTSVVEELSLALIATADLMFVKVAKAPERTRVAPLRPHPVDKLFRTDSDGTHGHDSHS